MTKIALSALLFLGVAAWTGCSNSAPAGESSSAPGGRTTKATASQIPIHETIHNDFYWTDEAGARILTRSGCLRQFEGLYYWYGGNPRGFREQYCYTSTDLVHWKNHGVIFRQDFDANRIDVLYNQPTKTYVMFLKYNGNGGPHFAIATADKPEGPFTFKSQTLVDNALIGDMSMYEDDDGKAYLAYVSWATGVNAEHGIYRMSDDYLSLDKRMYLWDIRAREAPHIFKRNGIYYYGTSKKTAGIQSSGTAYYTATNLEGPWSAAKPLNTPGSKNSWDSQVDFVYPIEGKAGTVYMFAGDRWLKDAAQGRNGDYVWLPMEFDGDVPTVNYYQDWEVDLSAGTWRKFGPARNLASGKNATASSAAGENAAGNVTDPADDQHYVNTRWESGPTDPQWIMVDLGAPAEVNRVILKWHAYAAKEFKIQTSTDASRWNDAYSTSMGSSSSVTDVTFKTTSARYVRMYGTARAPVPAGRGFGRTRTGGGADTRPGAATRPSGAQAPGGVTRGNGSPIPAELAGPHGYSLFDFEVLKD